MSTSTPGDELRLWEEFLAVTKRHSELIREEDADGLIAALRERERIIAAIKSLGTSDADDGALAELRAEALRINGENEEEIRAWLTEIDAEIKKMRASHKSAAGYGRGLSYAAPDYLDTEL